MISVITFALGLRIAGAVQNTASFASGSGVASQCGRYASHTTIAPRIPPRTCATTYPGTFAHGNVPIVASPIVTAGLRCAPLTLPTEYTASVTASAQPVVITIQPASLPLVRFSTTLATTPSPRMTRIAVPRSSARSGDMGGGQGAGAAILAIAGCER